MSAPLAVLDVNIWLDYFREDEPAVLEAQRQRLRDATRRGLVRPMLTSTLVQELAGTCEPEGYELYRAMMLFAWDVCEERMLAVEDDRAKLEIFWERKLTLDQAFVPLAMRRGYREHQMLDAEWARGVAAEVKAAQDADYHDERARLANTFAGLDEHDAKLAAEGQTVTPWRDAILRDEASREALIMHWALDEMVACAMHEGFPFARDRLPDPRTLPSFYVPKVLHVHRIHGVLLEERSPTKTDIFDHNALQDAAAYADIFVTADGALRKLAGRTPLLVRVLDFAQWDTALLAMLASA